MGKKIEYMPVKSFIDAGLLQEINRRMLHPMGLALEVTVERDGSATFSGVQDFREDPEGLCFDGVDRSKYVSAKALFEAKRVMREERLGYHIQPVPAICPQAPPRPPAISQERGFI